MGSSLRHVGSFIIAVRGLFVVVCGRLSSGGMWVFSSSGARVPEHEGSVVCSTWALVEVRELSSCGTWALVVPRRVGS